MPWLVLYRLRWAIVATIGLLAVASAGYVVIEGYGWLDALYMAVITLATIGFGEVHPLGTGGRIFTIVVIGVAFTTLVYAVAVLTNLFVSGEPAVQR